MDIFFWITDLMIPFIMILIGFVMRKHPPKDINPIYGYRTARSMQSQEAWDYAHQVCGKVWLICGPITLILIIASKIITPRITGLKPDELTFYHLAVSLVILILTIPIVETALSKRFDHKNSGQ